MQDGGIQSDTETCMLSSCLAGEKAGTLLCNMLPQPLMLSLYKGFSETHLDVIMIQCISLSHLLWYCIMIGDDRAVGQCAWSNLADTT